VATRQRSKRTLSDLERQGPMRASSTLPIEERPTRCQAPGLQAARLAAGMSIEQVAEISGYGAGVVRAAENGAVYHWGTISRISSAIPGHNLRLIRDEGG
jgi:hypothetical protein